MDELEKEWQMANDGFLAGVDFKTWLANQVIALRAAAQHGVQADVCPSCGGKGKVQSWYAGEVTCVACDGSGHRR
jgi:hypothetical protein